MIGLILLYTVIFACWKPYTLRIHNSANIFNQSVILLFLVFQLLEKNNLLNDTLKIICLYATITLIVVALLLQVIRVYVFKKSSRRLFKVEKVDINKKLDLMKSKNPYLIYNKIPKKIDEKEN